MISIMLEYFNKYHIFLQAFIMKNFMHSGKFKEEYNEHICTHHEDTNINLSLCWLYHEFLSLNPSLYQSNILFLYIIQSEF